MANKIVNILSEKGNAATEWIVASLATFVIFLTFWFLFLFCTIQPGETVQMGGLPVTIVYPVEKVNPDADELPVVFSVVVGDDTTITTTLVLTQAR